MERLRNKQERHEILTLWNGLLIGLSITDVQGYTYRLNSTLQLCVEMHDQEGNLHLGVYHARYVEASAFAYLDIPEAEWAKFRANVALNEVTEKNPQLTTGLLK